MPADFLSNLLSGFLGAVVGATLTFMNQVWRYGREAFLSRVDELSNLIFEAADAGGEYWVAGQPTPDLKYSIAERLSADMLSQTKVEGFQQKIDILRVVVRTRLCDEDREMLLDRTAVFFEALTGGDFGAPGRKPDAKRSRQIYRAATALVLHLRVSSVAPRRRAVNAFLKRWGVLFEFKIG